MDTLLTIENLHTHFFLDEGIVRAVDGMSLAIPRGVTVGLVGESGCGKSITAYSILQLIAPPGKIVEGTITLHRKDEVVELTRLPADGEEIRRVRGHEIAMIFQEPMTSLSPVHAVGDQIIEAVRLHNRMGRREAHEYTIHLMDRVGIPDARQRFRQFPHEMSGGLRQRAMIAMALSCKPSLLIADEPTTALDVTIQAQILALMQELQREFTMSILLITHDLGVVAEMAEQVAVMYLGRIVEQAGVRELYANPQHPYTRALLQSIPGRVPRKSALQVIAGSIPDPLQRLPGCPFHPRCAEAVDGRCDVGDRPLLTNLGDDHHVACILRESVKV